MEYAFKKFYENCDSETTVKKFKGLYGRNKLTRGT